MKKTYSSPKSFSINLIENFHILADSRGNGQEGHIGTEEVTIGNKGDYTGQSGVVPTAKELNLWEDSIMD